jgi:hypothetical protein
MLLWMRTTIDLNDQLMRKLKAQAAAQGITFLSLVETALRGVVEGKSQAAMKFKLRWKTEKGRLLPGIRVDDRDSLFDAMKGD